MAPVTLRDALTSSPTLYPIGIDPRADAVQLISLTREDYAAASFLDGRLLTPNVKVGWALWPEFRAAAAGLPNRCYFIFHISHVGSTLLSRLLDLHPGVFSLREPALLRVLADAHLALDPAFATAVQIKQLTNWSEAEFDDRTGIYLGVWSRTFDPGQVAIIKATSFVCEMAERLLERIPDARAVFLYVSPPVFLKALLDGAMSDITSGADKRMFRLVRRLGSITLPNSPGESVAMSWVCEMSALHAVCARFMDRVLWMDFDRFLQAPADELLAAFHHFHVKADLEFAHQGVSGPVMRQYAKAPSQAFDAQFRDQLLRQSEQRHGLEIARGIDWLQRIADRFPQIRELPGWRV